MPKFSKQSAAKLNTCHPDLQRLMNKVIETTDIIILCGHRGKEEQEKAFAEGKSKAHWGQSKHNSDPSLAVDIAPYPLDWNNTKAFDDLALKVLAVAQTLGINIRWGGNFTNLKDRPHFELYNKNEG